MTNPSVIKILGKTSNERGDLFTRLGKDLFFSLGYDDLELNVMLPGREIDIQGAHRFEPRRVLAECKAHDHTIGGADINKFLGVLTRERIKYANRPIAGYFVSLSGFTPTSVEQEQESGDGGIILFDGLKVIDELQRSHVIVSIAEAAEKAGQCALYHGLADAKLENAELIIHDTGYIWVIFYSQGKELNHFSLIHADGTPISPAIANLVVNEDRNNDGKLFEIQYLAPPPPAKNIAAQKTETLAHYRKWLGEECGYIQLDGLPADNDLSATKLRLEKLFVPLNVNYSKNKTDADQTEPAEEVVESIGSVLERISHLAILANPGGGKSTLLKRLATAYSFPARRKEIPDRLPDRNWLPLYMRCRDLRDRTRRPIIELLQGISSYANMDETQGKCFLPFLVKH